jgi:hypothetical protein
MTDQPTGKLMTDEEFADFKARSEAAKEQRRTGRLARGIAEAAKQMKTEKKNHKPRALWKFEQGCETYRTAHDGERNTILSHLALLGASLEKTGHFLHGQTREKLIEISYENNYIQTDGLPRIESIIDSMRAVSDKEHRDDLVGGTTRGGGIKALHTIVPAQHFPLLSQHGSILSQSTRIAQQIHVSNHSDDYKRVGYHLLAWFTVHGYVASKYSARAAASGSGVSKSTAHRAIKALAADPSINIEIQRGHGTDEPGKVGKTTVVIVNIVGLPTEPLENPAINLNDYVNHGVDDYISGAQELNRATRRAWRQETNTTAEPAAL